MALHLWFCWSVHLNSLGPSFIHLVVCLTTGPKPLPMFLEDYIDKISTSHTFLFLHNGADERMCCVFWGFCIGVIKDASLLGCDTATLGNWFTYPVRQHCIPEDQNPEIKCFPLSLLQINTMWNKKSVFLKLFKFYVVCMYVRVVPQK
jgi:hypothetical protein